MNKLRVKILQYFPLILLGVFLLTGATSHEMLVTLSLLALFFLLTIITGYMAHLAEKEE